MVAETAAPSCGKCWFFAMQTSGFAIVRTAQFASEDYRSSPGVSTEQLTYVTALWAAAPLLHPPRYRGIGRDWLQPFHFSDPGLIAHPNNEFEPDHEYKARRAYREFLGEWRDTYEEDLNEELLSDRVQVNEVFGLLEEPGAYEILRICRRDFHPTPLLLGYDVGQWCYPFSVIADSFAMPRWHPPPPDAFCDLVDRLAGLNEYLLFPTPGEAQAFREWYAQQEWAEIGPDEGFPPIEISTV